MIRTILNILLPILFLLYHTYGQIGNQLALVDGEKTSYLPTYVREGQIYFSLIHFAEALSLDYSFDTKNEKVEIQFDEYSITCCNQKSICNSKK